jgi:hypothetical protein
VLPTSTKLSSNLPYVHTNPKSTPLLRSSGPGYSLSSKPARACFGIALSPVPPAHSQHPRPSPRRGALCRRRRSATPCLVRHTSSARCGALMVPPLSQVVPRSFSGRVLLPATLVSVPQQRSRGVTTWVMVQSRSRCLACRVAPRPLSPPAASENASPAAPISVPVAVLRKSRFRATLKVSGRLPRQQLLHPAARVGGSAGSPLHQPTQSLTK